MQDDAAAAGSRLYWEDLEVGRVEHFGHYEVTKEEIIEFASTYDPQAMHLDEEAAKHTVAGGLCASGFHTCAMLMRMLCDGFLVESNSMGSPGIETLKWRRPVRPGDVGPPAIVERNQVVPLTYLNGGLAIRTEGRVLDRAAAGEAVRVMNLASRTTVTGVVRADGSVEVH